MPLVEIGPNLPAKCAEGKHCDIRIGIVESGRLEQVL